MKMLSERELLSDLAKLLRKYGPEPFETLASWISSPEASERFATLLRQSASIARKSGVNSPAKKTNEIDLVLKRLEREVPDKAALLRRFSDDVLSRTLPVPNHKLADFAQELGAKVGSRDSRSKLVAILIERLAEFPLEEIRRHLNRFEDSPDADRSLSAWAGLIMRDAPK
jgi:hypothetical protein